MGNINKAHIEAMKALQNAKDGSEISEENARAVKEAHHKFYKSRINEMNRRKRKRAHPQHRHRQLPTSSLHICFLNLRDTKGNG